MPPLFIIRYQPLTAAHTCPSSARSAIIVATPSKKEFKLRQERHIPENRRPIQNMPLPQNGPSAQSATFRSRITYRVRLCQRPWSANCPTRAYNITSAHRPLCGGRGKTHQNLENSLSTQLAINHQLNTINCLSGCPNSINKPRKFEISAPLKKTF